VPILFHHKLFGDFHFVETALLGMIYLLW